MPFYDVCTNNDYNSFLSSFVPASSYSSITKEKFSRLQASKKSKKLMLENAIPNLGLSTKYIACKQQGDFAVYYAESFLDDTEYLTIDAFCFSKQKGEWKVFGKSYGLCKARPGSNTAKKGLASWVDEKDIINTVNTHEKFSIESLKEASITKP
jgi:hypothetical protein